MKIIPANTKGDGLRIGVVQARFNEEITGKLLQGAQRALAEAKVRESILIKVAGALEIPLALQAMADTGEFDALVALGCVVKGDTYHFEVVCNESAAGVTRVALDYTIPIGNGVLTTFTESQAHARAEQKGYEAVFAALELVGVEDAIAEALDD
jgi:6,7-dimethyl-8-ribityllumazine synthase